MFVLNQYRKLIIAGALCLISVFNAQAQNKAYVEKYKPLCDSLSAEYGIPSNVIIGVAMLESANGNSKVCRLLHNHFGIVGKNNLRETHNIKSRYKAFENDTQSFVYFCKLVSSRKYYPKLKGTENINKWLFSIGRAGYCAKPKFWSRTIITLLKKSNLL
jgi:Bax protein